MISFSVENKNVDVYPAAAPDRPVVYLNTFLAQEEMICRALQNLNCPDFNLVAVTNLEWDHDMAPWYIPPISKDDTPCTGGADDYLELLTGKIMPKAEENLKGEPAWRGISGYSLAGLFAVYSIYQTDLFSRAASMSGSLWCPGIKDYVFSHEMKTDTDHIYFSLGEKEAKTSNPYLQTVQENTDEICRFYAEKGIDTVFILNPGNHYVDPDKRTAAGIDWILRR